MNEVVNCCAYQDGKKVAHLQVAEVSEALKVRGQGQFVWIGLYEPDEKLLREVQSEFHLHDLAVEDALRAHQRPKLEEYGEDLFIVVRTGQLDGETIELGETHFFVGVNYLVSVRHGASLPYTEVRARCEHTPALLKKGTGFVLYALLDFIVDNYFPILESLEERVEALETEVFEEPMNRDTTMRTYHLKRDLLRLKRGVSPLIDVCTRLERYDLALIHKEVRPYFRDVQDHAMRINERIDTMREMLSSVLEANLSLMSVNQNEVMKKLAAWAAVLGAPTLLASIWGMNFETMPELHIALAYPVALTLMIGSAFVLYGVFRRTGWL